MGDILTHFSYKYFCSFQVNILWGCAWGYNSTHLLYLKIGSDFQRVHKFHVMIYRSKTVLECYLQLVNFSSSSMVKQESAPIPVQRKITFPKQYHALLCIWATVNDHTCG